MGCFRIPVRSTNQAFDRVLARHEIPQLIRGKVTTLQINMGTLCNQACHHCHVGAGPDRVEVMPHYVAMHLIQLLKANPAIETVDLTGEAPELNPSFRFMVREARKLGRSVIDRCNLTVLLRPEAEDLPAFLAEKGVHIVGSLPCYLAENVERQRGPGVFERSIAVLRRLNELGYGRPGSSLRLDLTHNPLGPFLPSSQSTLEEDYRTQLGRRYGVTFHHLRTITNMPIARFADSLMRTGQHEAYMTLLAGHFNPGTVPGLMCRSLVSVGWDGRLYDCDFNQMLGIEIGTAAETGVRTLRDVGRFEVLEGGPVATGDHCFGCTAGAGSGCFGAIE